MSGISVRLIEATGSTNADLLALAEHRGAWTPGTWLVALRQDAGRGRRGRQWDSATGNFHGSTMLVVDATWPPLPSLSLVTGIAVYEAVAQVCGGAPAGLALKWPNDLLVGAAKLGGILIEAQGDAVVVGVGVNLERAPKIADRPTIDLAQLGHAVAVEHFADTLAQCFAEEVERWAKGGEWLHRWEARAHPRGTRITRASIAAGEAPLTGAFDGLEQDGSLRLRMTDGQMVVLRSGEITAQV